MTAFFLFIYFFFPSPRPAPHARYIPAWHCCLVLSSEVAETHNSHLEKQSLFFSLIGVKVFSESAHLSSNCKRATRWHSLSFLSLSLSPCVRSHGLIRLCKAGPHLPSPQCLQYEDKFNLIGCVPLYILFFPLGVKSI